MWTSGQRINSRHLVAMLYEFLSTENSFLEIVNVRTLAEHIWENYGGKKAR